MLCWLLQRAGEGGGLLQLPVLATTNQHRAQSFLHPQSSRVVGKKPRRRCRCCCRSRRRRRCRCRFSWSDRSMLHPGSDCSSGRSRNRSRSSDRSSNGTLHTHLLTPFSTTLGSAPTSPGAHVTPSVAIINALLAEEEHGARKPAPAWQRWIVVVAVSLGAGKVGVILPSSRIPSTRVGNPNPFYPLSRTVSHTHPACGAGVQYTMRVNLSVALTRMPQHFGWGDGWDGPLL